MTHRAYVGIGTNLGDRVANLERALLRLRRLGAIRAQSSLYRTKPWGKLDQPWFLNAVVSLETELSAPALLEEMKKTENELGRRRGERWGPRAIDLDLLLYDDLEMKTPELCLPHPHLRERAFVLTPLAEIDERFAAMRDALDASELAGVALIERESAIAMSLEGSAPLRERLTALARFLAETDAVRVRVERAQDEIELEVRPRRATPADRQAASTPSAAAPRIDTIKADLVGIFHVGRPVPAEGDALEGDRELGYIEALGIRTSVHSMGAGRLVSVATADGSAVEYGQPLFLIARGR
ncbi:MAG TPA: 2-amino-4-hydroxy-6-hydroxymethyldihydropteridine diphosphokinase [Candidatus Babeliales bacterium]|nr:2-amino-4-hydroxy-6-hydroxymethyldihydropteridine diphosphokinase [Candidatus Babeliales bacterium]